MASGAANPGREPHVVREVRTIRLASLEGDRYLRCMAMDISSAGARVNIADQQFLNLNLIKGETIVGRAIVLPLPGAP